ncbi:MAG: lipopolysaccharide transport system permease protein [Candidatus Azotimanducaceae bacterium]|jgi:lipopolysaccharide transport system permease protein
MLTREESVSPAFLLSSVFSHQSLIYQLVKRDIGSRYKGSILGILWAVANPVLMLVIYTFVFSVIFNARWGGSSAEQAHFSIFLFSGLICHSLLAEILTKSSDLILNQPNYVTKVIFPLEILPLVAVLSSVFQTLVNLFVLFVGVLVFGAKPHITFLLAPIVLLPLVILSLGFSMLLSSIGVFVRDLGQVIGVFCTALLFLSPVFFPLEAVPERFRSIVLLNPLTFVIDQLRKVVIEGQLPDWQGLILYFFVAVFVAWVGFYFFQRARKGFADVM